VGWTVVAPLVGVYWALLCAHVEPRHRAGRLKQWLNLLRRRFAEAEATYQAVRTVNDPDAIGRWLDATSAATPAPAATVV
jgi:tRNA-dihydrouridine synthase C